MFSNREIGDSLVLWFGFIQFFMWCILQTALFTLLKIVSFDQQGTYMNNQTRGNADNTMALWGGLECTVNRVRDQYFSQMERNGHAARLQDIERFASLGVSAIRYPVLWERTAPGDLSEADWSWSDDPASQPRRQAGANRRHLQKLRHSADGAVGELLQ